MSGTSMATPITAGNAALVRQYFTSGFYPNGFATTGAGFTPSAALMKAVLIGSASAVDIDFSLISAFYGTEYTLDQIRDLTGFGQAMLLRALSLASIGGSNTVTRANGALPSLLLPGLVVSGVSTGESDPPPSPGKRGRDPIVAHGATLDWCIDVSSNPALFPPGSDASIPLSLTLVWTDPAGFPGAAYALVNDLDLEVGGMRQREVGYVYACARACEYTLVYRLLKLVQTHIRRRTYEPYEPKYAQS